MEVGDDCTHESLYHLGKAGLEDKLKEVLEFTYSLIQRIERDYIPIPQYSGVPCLSANGLWLEEYETPSNFIKIEKIWHLLGELSIAEIAKSTDVSFDYVYDFVKKLESKGLVSARYTPS